MATQIRVSVVGLPKLQRALSKMNPGVNKKILRDSLLESARTIQREAAKNQILAGGGGKGSGMTPPHPKFLTSRHGGEGLVGSIHVDEGPLPFAIEVGTDLVYGAVHEFGLGPYPKRPFMQPALDKMAPRFGDIVIKHWKRQAGL